MRRFTIKNYEGDPEETKGALDTGAGDAGSAEGSCAGLAAICFTWATLADTMPASISLGTMMLAPRGLITIPRAGQWEQGAVSHDLHP